MSLTAEAVQRELFEQHFLSDLSDRELRRLINSIVIRRLREEKLLAESSRDSSTEKAEAEAEKSRREALVDEIFSSIRGLGVLDGLLKDDEISEIMINGYDKIFIDRQGELSLSGVRFENERLLFDIIQRIVGRSGREVNISSPIAEAMLDGGERVSIVLPPACVDGPVVTIRRFPKKRTSMADLIAYNTITAGAASFLEELVINKFNIFISGGTSSGKTTFLNALSDYIPKHERIITIEDSAELQLSGIPNLIRLEARNSNTAGSGEISIRELIRASLRMRPDRIIVGEVRGEEAIDMLGAMNTGHDGSLSTGHANSSGDMLYRLETMVLQGSAAFPVFAVREYIASSVDIIVHMCKTSDGRRRVAEISEVEGTEDGRIKLNYLYVLSGGKLSATGNGLKNREKLLFKKEAPASDGRKKARCEQAERKKRKL